LVRESESQLVPQVLVGRFRVFGVTAQGQPVDDLPVTRAASMEVLPGVQQLRDLIEPALMLEVEGVQVIVLFGTGGHLIQDRLAILREGEAL
jgi:hypothetical protein